MRFNCGWGAKSKYKNTYKNLLIPNSITNISPGRYTYINHLFEKELGRYPWRVQIFLIQSTLFSLNHIGATKVVLSVRNYYYETIYVYPHMVHMFLGKMLILAILLKLAKPKPLAPAAGSPAT